MYNSYFPIFLVLFEFFSETKRTNYNCIVARARKEISGNLVTFIVKPECRKMSLIDFYWQNKSADETVLFDNITKIIEREINFKIQHS